MTGVEFLRAAKVNYPNTIRIVLSGYTELQAVTDAINEGAIYRFLTKPWEDDQLREHIHRAFEYKELLDENQKLDLKIRAANRELVAANRQLGDVLQRKSAQMERDETSLAITREALHNIALPLLGVDDAGLIAFANPAAETLFHPETALMGAELASALPAVDAIVAGSVEGCHSALQINDIRYQVKWSAMGVNSRSRGKLITFTAMALKP
jgi:CheY-like chemotaxis protein